MSQTSLMVGLVGHFKFDYASFGKLAVSKIEPRIWLAVEQHTFYVSVAVTHFGCFHNDIAAIGQNNVGIRHKWSADDILVGARANRIET